MLPHHDERGPEPLGDRRDLLGNPAEEIPAIAERLGASLIVMGSIAGHR